jgi:hypothetical protein
MMLSMIQMYVVGEKVVLYLKGLSGQTEDGMGKGYKYLNNLLSVAKTYFKIRLQNTFSVLCAIWSAFGL